MLPRSLANLAWQMARAFARPQKSSIAVEHHQPRIPTPSRHAQIAFTAHLHQIAEERRCSAQLQQQRQRRSPFALVMTSASSTCLRQVLNLNAAPSIHYQVPRRLFSVSAPCYAKLPRLPVSVPPEVTLTMLYPQPKRARTPLDAQNVEPPTLRFDGPLGKRETTPYRLPSNMLRPNIHENTTLHLHSTNEAWRPNCLILCR